METGKDILKSEYKEYVKEYVTNETLVHTDMLNYEDWLKTKEVEVEEEQPKIDLDKNVIELMTWAYRQGYVDCVNMSKRLLPKDGVIREKFMESLGKKFNIK